MSANTAGCGDPRAADATGATGAHGRTNLATPVAAVAAVPHDPHHADPHRARGPRRVRLDGARHPARPVRLAHCSRCSIDAQRATAAAQTTLDNAAVQGDGVQLQNLMVSVSGILAQQSSSDMIAAFRIGPPSPLAPQDFASPAEFEAIISDELRDAGARGPRAAVVAVGRAARRGRGTVPGIVVGQQLLVPDVGGYELYLAYDLGDAVADARLRRRGRSGSSASVSCCSSAASRGSCCDR